LSGYCLCGAVQFLVTPPFTDAGRCQTTVSPGTIAFMIRRDQIAGSLILSLGCRPALGGQLSRALLDPVLVGDCVPACRAPLTRSANPPGGLQLAQQPEHLIAIRVGSLGKR
jgi:hypothetical protein